LPKQLKGICYERINIIEKNGKISSKDLSKIIGVSGPAISQWMKPLVDEGVLTWCDEKGGEFEDTASLEKAKRAGNAFIRVANFNCLPTPYLLTGDKRWDKDGDLYKQYDLEFDDDCTEIVVVSERDVLSQKSEAVSKSSGSAEYQDFSKMNEGVNVLSKKYEAENKKIDTKEEINSSRSTDDLFGEFQDILSSEKNVRESQKGNNQNHSALPPGILPI
jgi:hypothetical protein